MTYDNYLLLKIQHQHLVILSSFSLFSVTECCYFVFAISRYPFFPIHYGGGANWKEVKALEAVVLEDDYDDIDSGLDFFGDSRYLIYGFEVNLKGGGHQHTSYIPGWKVRNYWYDSDEDIYYNTSDYTVEVESDTRNSHAHTTTIWRHKVDGSWVYEIGTCRYGSLSDADQYDDSDYVPGFCSDGHTYIERE